MEKVNSIKDLFKTNKCSPLIAYFLIILISIIMIINAKETVNKLNKKNNNYKYYNIFKLFTYYELSFLLVLGILLLGFCQHNQENLAWICLMFPLFNYLIKNIIVFMSLYSIQKNEPEKEKEKEENKTNIANLPITVPSTNSIQSQQQMLQFNEALQNNNLQNENINANNANINANINANSNENSLNINTNNMRSPLNIYDNNNNIYDNNNNMSGSMPMPTNF